MNPTPHSQGISAAQTAVSILTGCFFFTTGGFAESPTQVHTHTVGISGHYHSHAKIVITVHADDSDAINNLPPLENDKDKNNYFTIGAGREGGIFSANLVSGFNREPNDIVVTGSTLHSLITFSNNAIPLINTLIIANNNYNDDIPYKTFPDSESDGRNSNSYIAGILTAVGVDPPDITGVNIPGYDIPVNAEHFD